LLGILVHKVSGQFYGDILRDRVFIPLDMKTARVISESDIIPNRAAGYRLVGSQLKNQEWVSPTLDSTADGSLYLSIADFVAWDRGLRAGAVLKPESWAQIYTPVKLNSGRSYPYGFGWQVDEWEGKPWYHHGGSWQGFETYISRYSWEDLTIEVLINLAQAEPQRFVDGIARSIDSKLVQIDPTTPIPDRNPKVTRRVRALLAAAAQGKLSVEDLPFKRADFASLSQEYETLLRPLGPVQKIDLVAQRALGDDEAYNYIVAYVGHAVRARAKIMADGQLAGFSVESE
jgi:CubicO group peptidase (beta-lactamase class C family)